MRTDARNVGRMLLVAAALLTFEATSAASDDKNPRTPTRSNTPATSDVRVTPPSGSPATADNTASPDKPVIRPAIAATTLDDIDRSIEKLSSTMKNLLKDFRPGSCPTVPARRPTSSWPSRAETAISVCRP